ncbi:lysine-sensitive aspartokinase 3 [Spirochaeta thermophila]|uniref:Aspartokinase n=1 Tax=Winmispira thermophila (strain ATCC 49972 / DSM 6192 / RI 19.B1) TaxID=665571 RepID=E0RQL1_WINT6|nr:lysine-sensitive aspartokinase 3 [Spirochaeta thermophila]ADN01515.1 aspartokinase 3 [Spirochaeta thermophila DSM 6192]
MVVMKFGGTSVQDAERMDRVLSIAEEELNEGVVLVASATAKTTDRLIQLTQASARGDEESVQSILNLIKTHHFQIAHDFLEGEYLEKAVARLETLFAELGTIVKGMTLLKEVSPRTLDAVVAFGEILSTTLLYHRALQRGLKARLLDSRNYIITDDSFGNATPDIRETYRRLSSGVKVGAGDLVIMQGFIASTPDGTTSTLGRGGSDYSAAIVGAGLHASRIEIWTDVHGVMTADPRIVPEAQPIPQLSYEEAAELAYFGAKVVHPSTIQPAVEKNIPVLVKNTMDPNGPGTTITHRSPYKGLKAIATKRNITLITIQSYRMLNAYGFLSRIFDVFAEYRTPVDLIATSEVSVSMTIDNKANLHPITRELSKIGKVVVEEEKAIISLVGEDVWKTHETILNAFSALQGIPVRMITMGSSHINLSLVVADGDGEESVRRLHRAFFEKG